VTARRCLQAWENLVRIVTSPTPFLYRHLLACLVFLYVFTFPFAAVDALRWAVVPVSAAVCLCFYGVLVLAQELENPLGYDANDIDLDGFRDIFTTELHAMHKFRFGEDVSKGRAPALAPGADRLAMAALRMVPGRPHDGGGVGEHKQPHEQQQQQQQQQQRAGPMRVPSKPALAQSSHSRQASRSVDGDRRTTASAQSRSPPIDARALARDDSPPRRGREVSRGSRPGSGSSAEPPLGAVRGAARDARSVGGGSVGRCGDECSWRRQHNFPRHNTLAHAHPHAHARARAHSHPHPTALVLAHTACVFPAFFNRSLPLSSSSLSIPCSLCSCSHVCTRVLSVAHLQPRSWWARAQRWQESDQRRQCRQVRAGFASSGACVV
jgi:hypothetical protein